MISAVSRVRRSGEVTTASISSASAAIQSAVACTCARPSALSPGSSPPSPLNFLSLVCGVSPCRTRISVVGVPRSPDQPTRFVGAGAAGADPTAAPVSSASLRIRSAWVFCSRGIQVYVVPGGASRLAAAANGFMSGCLIFQLPDICSITSLESIRTWSSAPGVCSW